MVALPSLSDTVENLDFVKENKLPFSEKKTCKRVDSIYGGKDALAGLACNYVLVTCYSRVPWLGHRSQSGPQPAGFLSAQQQLCLVMFVDD